MSNPASFIPSPESYKGCGTSIITFPPTEILPTITYREFITCDVSIMLQIPSIEKHEQIFVGISIGGTPLVHNNECLSFPNRKDIDGLFHFMVSHTCKTFPKN